MGIFDSLTSPIENALDLADDLLEGKELDNRKIAKAASATIITVAGVAAADEALDLLQSLLEDD